MKKSIKQRVRVCGPKDVVPKDAVILNVTSNSTSNLGRSLSPFFLGPVKLYNGYVAENVENAWQFAKVYEQYADVDGAPLAEYWDWAFDGWSNRRAERYPMGKGAIPLYSYWEGARLGYIEARKEIYIPLYVEALGNLIKWLEDYVSDQETQGKQVYLFDYDGYDNVKLGLTLDEVIENPKRKMGHAFVLAMLLEEK